MAEHMDEAMDKYMNECMAELNKWLDTWQINEYKDDQMSEHMNEYENEQMAEYKNEPPAEHMDEYKDAHMDEEKDGQKEDLIRKFFEIHVLLHRYYSHNLKKFGIFGNPHLGQGRVLSLLKHAHSHISQKELSYMLHMRNQSLGEILAKLERSGHIIRTPSEKDRRALFVSLTEAGASMKASVEKRNEELNSIFNCLSKEELEQLESFLIRITDSLEQKLKDSSTEHEDGECCEAGRHHLHHHDLSHSSFSDCHSHEGRERCEGERHRHDYGSSHSSFDYCQMYDNRERCKGERYRRGYDSSRSPFDYCQMHNGRERCEGERYHCGYGSSRSPFDYCQMHNGRERCESNRHHHGRFHSPFSECQKYERHLHDRRF